MVDGTFDKTNTVFASTNLADIVTADFKMTHANTALMGGTWATTMEVAVAAEADWSLPLSMWMMCGKTSVVGVHGTPNWDSTKAATTGCLMH